MIFYKQGGEGGQVPDQVVAAVGAEKAEAEAGRKALESERSAANEDVEKFQQESHTVDQKIGDLASKAGGLTPEEAAVKNKAAENTQILTAAMRKEMGEKARQETEAAISAELGLSDNVVAKEIPKPVMLGPEPVAFGGTPGGAKAKAQEVPKPVDFGPDQPAPVESRVDFGATKLIDGRVYTKNEGEKQEEFLARANQEHEAFAAAKKAESAKKLEAGAALSDSVLASRGTETSGEKSVEKPDGTIEISPEDIVSEASAVAASPEKKFDSTEARRIIGEARKARKALAEAQAKAKSYEGLDAIRLLVPGALDDKKMAEAAVEEAREAYESARAEYVGEKINRQTKENQDLADETAAEIGEAKGISTKIYDAYKKSGELNLYNALPDSIKPTSRIGMMAAKMLSVRTGVSLGLLGVSAAAGAGAAVGIGAIAARRFMSGIGATAGSYDLMRNLSDRKVESVSKEAIGKMSRAELTESMEKMESRAMVGGKAIGENESYKSLRQEFIKKYKEEGVDKPMQDMIKESDARLEDLKSKDARNIKIMKAAAVGVGVLAGSGALAKAAKSLYENVDWALGYSGVKDSGVWHAAGAVKDTVKEGIDTSLKYFGLKSEAPVAMATGSHPETGIKIEPIPVKTVDLTQVRRGDGFGKIFDRQIRANPENFGFDASKGIDKEKWIHDAVTKAEKLNHLIEKNAEQRLSFDAGKPSFVKLNSDLTMSETNATEYTQLKNIPKPPIERIVSAGPAVESNYGGASTAKIEVPVVSESVLPGITEVLSTPESQGVEKMLHAVSQEDIIRDIGKTNPELAGKLKAVVAGMESNFSKDAEQTVREMAKVAGKNPDRAVADFRYFKDVAEMHRVKYETYKALGQLGSKEGVEAQRWNMFMARKLKEDFGSVMTKNMVPGEGPLPKMGVEMSKGSSIRMGGGMRASELRPLQPPTVVEAPAPAAVAQVEARMPE
ncbi:MAG: hypothetical protein WCJ29_00460 [bacterium]